MKKIVVLIAVICLISCKKNGGVSAVSNGTSIWFKNNVGINLLNSSVPNAINSNDLDIYLMKNGVKSLVYHPLMDLKEGFRVESTSQGNLMTLYFDTAPEAKTQNKVVMFIRYKDGSEDKLTGEFNANQSSAVYLVNVWVNDVLKWTSSPGNGSALVEIIK